MPAKPRRRGISLIDLVLTVAVMGILAVVGGIRYSAAVQRHSVEQAARRMAADLNFLRDVARIRRQPVTVVFDTSNHRYSAAGISDPDHPAAAFNVNVRQYASSVSLTNANFGGDATLVFNSYGVPDSAGTITVVCSTFSQPVTVAAGTGGVTAP